MASRVKLYIERAENEFRLAKAIFNLSEREYIKAELEISPTETFYSAVISHSYYSIFYSAKAILLTKNIETKPPEEHKRTFEEFKKNFVNSGILDSELIRIYENLAVRADDLLSLFAHEKWKRGHFTYHTLSQANMQPARESLENAKKFIASIKKILEVQK